MQNNALHNKRASSSSSSLSDISTKIFDETEVSTEFDVSEPYNLSGQYDASEPYDTSEQYDISEQYDVSEQCDISEQNDNSRDTLTYSGDYSSNADEELDVDPAEEEESYVQETVTSTRSVLTTEDLSSIDEGEDNTETSTAAKHKFLAAVTSRLSAGGVAKSPISKVCEEKPQDPVIESFIQKKLQILQSKTELKTQKNEEKHIVNKSFVLPRAWQEKVAWMALNNKIDTMKTAPLHDVNSCKECIDAQAKIEKDKLMKLLISKVNRKFLEEYCLSKMQAS